MSLEEHPLTTPESGESEPAAEICDPRHFYAAHVYEEAMVQRDDVTAVVEQARALGYSVRYWWLSEVLALDGDSSDPLIVCVHCPSGEEDAGMDLYRALRQREVAWDSLEAASVEEYRRFGKVITQANEIFKPDGNALFPEVSTLLSYSETSGLTSVLLVLADLRMNQFSPEARDTMRLSLQRLSHLFLLLLGNMEKLEEAGQPPAQTFAFFAGLVQEMTRFYQLRTDAWLSSEDDTDMPF